MIRMPPHCDTLDGPVVTAAKRALEAGNVNLILPYAHAPAENEIKKAFDRTMTVRKQGNKEAIDIAELWFYETVVRLHREGEGASYTGLKPAGLEWGPVLPKVEKAMEKGYPNELIEFLSRAVEEQVNDRLKRFMETKNYDDNDVAAAREHVEAMLDLELYSHHLYMNIKHGNGHGEESEGEHEH
jgi:hypothetical protein